MSENTTHESPAYEKRGYLNHEFRLFHLRGQMDTPVAYHYHDFHKVLILLNGEADYIVEGRSYHLRPLDIVLVGAHCLHKPVVPYKSRYERKIRKIGIDKVNHLRYYSRLHLRIHRCGRRYDDAPPAHERYGL